MFFGVVAGAAAGAGRRSGEALLLPLLATQILWVNLVTDSLPALAVGVDPPDAGLMRRAPRDPRTGVITPRMWYGIALAAAVIGAGTLLTLDAGLPGGLIAGGARSNTRERSPSTRWSYYQLFAVFCAAPTRRAWGAAYSAMPGSGSRSLRDSRCRRRSSTCRGCSAHSARSRSVQATGCFALASHLRW